MMMTLSRNHVHVSKSGLSVEFKAGVPTYVPPRLVQDVVGLGGQVVEAQDQAVVDKEMQEANAQKILREGREPAIEAAMRIMATRNARGDFTGGGKPNLNILSRLAGMTVGADEMEPIWRKVKNDLVTS